MKVPAERNPKAETRRPKEGRSPKSECRGAGGIPDVSSDFWRWGDELSKEPLVLKDDPVLPPPPEDLAERTAQFGESIIRFAKRIPRNPVNNRLIDQLVGAGTSVGANYCEADEAESKKDFRHKIGICVKEARETKHWLRMIVAAAPEHRAAAADLWREAKELTLVFGAITRSCDKPR